MTSRAKQLISSFALAILGVNLVAAQTPAKCALTVKVTGVHDTDGDVKVTLRSGPDTVVQSKEVEIDRKTMTATAVFPDLPAGAYGVSAIHDENKNGKLDFNEVGMPVEGYGHSNNPARRMGPPPFDDTKFTLSQPTTSIEIQLIYWP
jgi:uncharacterized protein (DUF2141 family)